MGMYLRSSDRGVYMAEKTRKDGFVHMSRIYGYHSGKGASYGCYIAVYKEGVLPGSYEVISETEYKEGVNAIIEDIRGILC